MHGFSSPTALLVSVGLPVALIVAIPLSVPQVVHTDGFRVLSPPVTDTLLSAGLVPTSVTAAALLLTTLVAGLVAVASKVFVASFP
jgi:hypothetical protein